MQAIGWVERGDNDPAGQRDIMRMPHCHLYHYEGVITGETRALKHVNYARLQRGEKPLDRLPEGYYVKDSPRYRVPFCGPQPINPVDVEQRALFEVVTV